MKLHILTLSTTNQSVAYSHWDFTAAGATKCFVLHRGRERQAEIVIRNWTVVCFVASKLGMVLLFVLCCCSDATPTAFL